MTDQTACSGKNVSSHKLIPAFHEHAGSNAKQSNLCREEKLKKKKKECCLLAGNEITLGISRGTGSGFQNEPPEVTGGDTNLEEREWKNNTSAFNFAHVSNPFEVQGPTYMNT